LAVGDLPIIEAVALFVKIRKHMEWLNRNIGFPSNCASTMTRNSEDGWLHFALNVGNRVIDHFTLKLIQFFVRFQRIGEDGSASYDVLTRSDRQPW
jgi:hypothetical protein